MDEGEFEVELGKQLVYWQKILYLQDWTVELKVVRQWEMEDAKTLAQCHWFLERRDAIISVLNPNDLAGVADKFIKGEECDYDISLVHELLHLHFASFFNEKDTIAHEQVINAISRGMVKVWREQNQVEHKVVEPHVPHVGQYL